MMTREEIKKDAYVAQWLNHYAKGSKKVYFLEFAQWCEWLNISPTEQIKKRMIDLQSMNPKIRAYFEDKLKEYVQVLVTKDYTSDTIHSKYTPIQSFFSFHRVNLRFRRGELRVKKEKGGLIEKYCLSNEEIRACLEVADLRDRALLLFMYHTGFSPVDVNFFNIEHIKTIYEPIEQHYYIAKERQKTRSPHATCISVEVLEAIKLMLRERGNPTKGALFTSFRGKRLSTRFINDALKKVVQTALPKERAEPFQAKSLRDSYEIALLRADIKQELKDLLFGHMRQGARDAYAFNELVIRETYEKVFKYLSTNGGKSTHKEIKSIKNEMEGFRITIVEQAKTITKVVEENKSLKGAYEKTNVLFEDLQRAHLKQAEDFAQTFEKLGRESAQKILEHQKDYKTILNQLEIMQNDYAEIQKGLKELDYLEKQKKELEMPKKESKEVDEMLYEKKKE